MTITTTTMITRLTSGQSASWSTMVPGPNFHLYVVIVGYTEYVSLNIKVRCIFWKYILLESSPTGGLRQCVRGLIRGAQLCIKPTTNDKILRIFSVLFNFEPNLRDAQKKLVSNTPGLDPDTFQTCISRWLLIILNTGIPQLQPLIHWLGLLNHSRLIFFKENS